MRQATRRVVRARAKGQLTIPREFRRALGIGDEALLSVTLVGKHLEVAPYVSAEKGLREYSEEDVARFLADDRLEPATAARVRRLLRSSAL